MARRNLTIQQRRRIRERQTIQGQRSYLSTDNLPQNDGLGPEQQGRIITHFGKQAEVVPLPATDPGGCNQPRRCFVRPNLDSLVTGDEVVWRDGDPAGVVEAVLERRSLLSRPDSKGNLRPVAANIDRIAVVIACEPAPHANLIDRYLVAAHHQAIKPLLILTKNDLPGSAATPLGEMLAIYTCLGYPVFRVSVRNSDSLQPVREYLAPFTSVLVGQSGVGKSSLINSLCPEAQASVGNLSAVAAKGRHTTTAVSLFRLQGGGELIDSPGIREFGLWHLDFRRVAEGFTEFSPHLGLCRFRDCQHLDEPGCALLEAVRQGSITTIRWQSYQQIVQSLAPR